MLRMIMALTIGLLYLPLAGLVGSSFGGFRGPWTFAWYGRVLADPAILSALGLSLQVGLMTALISVVLGTAAACALERSSGAGRRIFEFLVWVPFVMPEIVIGLSLLIWFVFLKFTLGSFSIVLAHVSFTLSYVILTVRAQLEGLEPSLEEAARDLGASPAKAFWKVTFPLILPGIGAGGLLAFILSFDDFLITFFTAGVGSDTLPVKIYSMIRFGVSPEVSALSTLMLAATLIAVLGIRARPL